MKPSIVTSRHWTREGLDQPLRPIELRDGAQAVDVLHFDDERKWVRYAHPQDGLYATEVYCGPAAPFPPTPPGMGHVNTIAPRTDLLHDICGSFGPDGLICERGPRHRTFIYLDSQHAASTEDGLVKW